MKIFIKMLYNQIGDGELFKKSDEMIDLVYNIPYDIEDKIVHLLYLGYFSDIIKNDDIISMKKLNYSTLKNLILQKKEEYRKL